MSHKLSLVGNYKNNQYSILQVDASIAIAIFIDFYFILSIYLFIY